MIYEIPNLIDPNLCKEVISYFDNSGQRNPPNEKYDFFDNRSLCINYIIDKTLLRKLQLMEVKISQAASKLFYEEPFLFVEHWDIVKWNPGMNMKVHTDNGDSLDGSNLSNRHYTSIIYLNDDYSGGETVFPTENKTCSPEIGKFVIFPSELPHGVSEVKDKDRYTIATWFTRTDTEWHKFKY
jgi:Rps23 Pro-64 3,4-dihydroxylase Tpa1-like proline 4-hydroxylase